MTARLVRNLSVVVVAAGLTTAGLVGQADAAATLTIHANHAIYAYGQVATVSGHVGLAGVEQVTLTVSQAGHPAVNRAESIDSAGNWHDSGAMVTNTTFTVTSGTQRASTRVGTQVRVVTAFRGGYKSKGGYHYVHARKHPSFAVGVAPSKTGKRIYVRLQVFTKHKWRKVQTKAYTLRKGSAVGVTFRGLAGHKYRLRGEFRGDSANRAKNSGWTHVRFV